MTGRASTLVAAGCAAVFLAALATKPTAAVFTAASTVGVNSLRVAALRDSFQVTPGTAVQPGTSTPVASGGVDTLALAFGTVPSARAFTSVFTVKNVGSQAQTATLALAGVSQVASAVFAASGSATAVLAPGASSTVTVTTSAAVAGHGSGTLRLGLAGSTWLYRDYALTLDEAPEAPASATATAKPAGRISLAWSASSTTVNLAGYDVYRSASGGAYGKLNAAPVAGVAYDDTATADGTSYSYQVRAVSSGAPVLQSLDSPAAAAIADATAPASPVAVALANGGGTGSAYVNAANQTAAKVAVTLPAGSSAADTVTVTVSNGVGAVTRTAPASAGAGTVTITLDTSAVADGTLTVSATSTDLAANVSAVRTATAPKDTVAPGAPGAAYVDNKNPAADAITGSAETGSTVRATQTLPSASGPYTAVAAGSAYSVTVAAAKSGSVTYVLTATDSAGNTSATTTLVASPTR